jgi:hypothetical protein
MPTFTTARRGTGPGARFVPIVPLAKAGLDRWLKGRPAAEAAWVTAAMTRPVGSPSAATTTG